MRDQQTIDESGHPIDHITSRIIQEQDGFIDIAISGPEGVGKTVSAWQIKQLMRSYFNGNLPDAPPVNPATKGARIFDADGNNGNGQLIVVQR